MPLFRHPIGSTVLNGIISLSTTIRGEHRLYPATSMISTSIAINDTSIIINDTSIALNDSTNPPTHIMLTTTPPTHPHVRVRDRILGAGVCIFAILPSTHPLYLFMSGYVRVRVRICEFPFLSVSLLTPTLSAPARARGLGLVCMKS